jgi:hypothetical protein
VEKEKLCTPSRVDGSILRVTVEGSSIKSKKVCTTSLFKVVSGNKDRFYCPSLFSFSVYPFKIGEIRTLDCGVFPLIFSPVKNDRNIRWWGKVFS